MADQDVELMIKFKEGDEAAFRTLFEKYKIRIINFAYKYIDDRKIAEEIAQEVFLRVYKVAATYRPDAKFSTWLFRIATNVCLNESRSRRYYKMTKSLESLLDVDGEDIKTEIADKSRLQPDEVLEKEEKTAFVKRAILRLPEKQRVALLLHTYHDFSYREISGQIGSSEKAVKSLIYRARQSLLRTLQPYIKGV